jgi:hypothetical protein
VEKKTAEKDTKKAVDTKGETKDEKKVETK